MSRAKTHLVPLRLTTPEHDKLKRVAKARPPGQRRMSQVLRDLLHKTKDPERNGK